MNLTQILREPNTLANLELAKDSLISKATNRVYKFENGIPVLYPDINEQMREHYKIDAIEFDYFVERRGGTEHDERRLREYIISLAPKKAYISLDLGCGCGWFAPKALKFSSVVISSDVSYENVAKTLEQNKNKNHYGIALDATALPFESESIDFVNCSEVIEHYPEPKSLISEVLRVLKPGGKAIFSTPYEERLQYYLCVHCNKPTPANAHLHSFNKSNLTEIFAKSGVKDSCIKFHIFGAKLLLHLRCHIFLKYLNFPLWKIADSIAKLISKKCAHIIIEITKS